LTRAETAAIGALLAGVAFAFSPALESQFTLPKLAAFYAGLATFVALCVVRLRRGGCVHLPQPVAAFATILALWWILTLPFAVHLRTALWGATGRGNGFVLHLSLLAFFVALGSMRIGFSGVRRITRIVLAVVVTLSGYAILQAAGVDFFTWPNVRPATTIGHPVPFAAILALGVPLGFAELLAARRRSALVIAAIATSTIVFALGTTLSRGPWIGAAGGLGVTLMLAWRGGGDRRARTMAIVGGAAVVIAATVWIGGVPGTRITQRVALLTRLTTDPSFMNRFEYFSAALKMVRERPLLGAGFETFGLLFPPLRPIEAASVDDNTIPTMVHNGPLQTAQATGVPGVLLWVCLQAAILIALVPLMRRRLDDASARLLAIGLAGALVSFAIQDLSGWEEISSSVFFWTVAGCAVALRASQADVRPAGMRGASRMAVAAAIGAAALAATGWTVVRELRIDAGLHAAAARNAQGDWDGTRGRIAVIRPLMADDASYLDRAAVVYLDRMRIAADAETYRSAVELLRRARERNHFDPYVLIHLIDAEALALFGRQINAPAADVVDAAERLVAIDPNNASAREAVARFRLASGSPPRALDEVRTAISLRPQRRGLRLLEGDIRRALGDRAGALESYRAEAAMHEGADAVWLASQQKVTAALIEAGDYDSALRESQNLVSKAPADPVGKRLLEAARAYSR
jgi:O-antigen ligase/tetratricopeptide (TPR) repeat protein